MSGISRCECSSPGPLRVRRCPNCPATKGRSLPMEDGCFGSADHRTERDCRSHAPDCCRNEISAARMASHWRMTTLTGTATSIPESHKRVGMTMVCAY
jgi:transposase InsO family protein